MFLVSFEPMESYSITIWVAYETGGDLVEARSFPIVEYLRRRQHGAEPRRLLRSAGNIASGTFIPRRPPTERREVPEGWVDGVGLVKPPKEPGRLCSEPNGQALYVRRDTHPGEVGDVPSPWFLSSPW